jgi:hypothetical protein
MPADAATKGAMVAREELEMAQRIADNASNRLAKYWFRAELMRDIVHKVVGETDDLKNLPKESWWEFETFLFYWLSALFVLVEGFNKLKLKDARVQKLFKAHVGHLKMVRHATYHFVLEEGPSPSITVVIFCWHICLISESMGHHDSEIMDDGSID